MHIAVQGDQPISLVYFKELELQLNCTDKKGSTPLHWASYLGLSRYFKFSFIHFLNNYFFINKIYLIKM